MITKIGMGDSNGLGGCLVWSESNNVHHVIGYYHPHTSLVSHALDRLHHIPKKGPIISGFMTWSCYRVGSEDLRMQRDSSSIGAHPMIHGYFKIDNLSCCIVSNTLVFMCKICVPSISMVGHTHWLSLNIRTPLLQIIKGNITWRE